MNQDIVKYRIEQKKVQDRCRKRDEKIRELDKKYREEIRRIDQEYQKQRDILKSQNEQDWDSIC